MKHKRLKAALLGLTFAGAILASSVNPASAAVSKPDKTWHGPIGRI